MINFLNKRERERERERDLTNFPQVSFPCTTCYSTCGYMTGTSGIITDGSPGDYSTPNCKWIIVAT
jgi:hypothetical protein